MKRHYETDPRFDGDEDAYTVKGWRGIAWHILGWETEPDEDTEWSGIEARTGKLVAVMIGDDRHFAVDEDEIQVLPRADYCGSCGQIGCSHDGYDREDRESEVLS